MGYQSITQIILVVVAVVVIFTYIQPKMTEIKAVQDEVVQYEEAVNKATEFNQLLSMLLEQSAEFTQAEIKALERYVPSEQDMVSVARDLEIIAGEARVVLSSIVLEDQTDQNEQTNRSNNGAPEDANDLLSQEITIDVSGNYNNTKNFVKLVENNAYPLELISFTIEGIDGAEDVPLDSNAVYSFALVYETYSLNTQ